jgi:transcriptional regulator with XRE-family HTH domain
MAAISPVRASGAEPGIGQMLREWRQRRRLSQMDLALDAGISARHLSFLETGRSKPSAEMVTRLAEELAVPFRDQNRMLLAAGFAPAYRELELADPEMEPVRAALQRVLDGHDPYPAVVVDGAWNLVAANSAVGALTAGADPELLQAPVNVLELTLDPRGMAPRILNLPEWRAHLLERLARQVSLSGSVELEALLEKLVALPAPDGSPYEGGIAGGHTHHSQHEAAREIAAPLRIASEPDGGGAELSFFSTISTFGTAIEITTAELAIEAFYPADRETAEALGVQLLPEG